LQSASFLKQKLPGHVRKEKKKLQNTLFCEMQLMLADRNCSSIERAGTAAHRPMIHHDDLHKVPDNLVGYNLHHF